MPFDDRGAARLRSRVNRTGVAELAGTAEVGCGRNSEFLVLDFEFLRRPAIERPEFYIRVVVVAAFAALGPVRDERVLTAVVDTPKPTTVGTSDRRRYRQSIQAVVVSKAGKTVAMTRSAERIRRG